MSASSLETVLEKDASICKFPEDADRKESSERERESDGMSGRRSVGLFLMMRRDLLLPPRILHHLLRLSNTKEQPFANLDGDSASTLCSLRRLKHSAYCVVFSS